MTLHFTSSVYTSHSCICYVSPQCTIAGLFEYVAYNDYHSTAVTLRHSMDSEEREDELRALNLHCCRPHSSLLDIHSVHYIPPHLILCVDRTFMRLNSVHGMFGTSI